MIVELKGHGEYLGVKKKGFALYRERKLKQVIPFHSLEGVLIAPNNTVSTNALVYLAMYNVPTILLSQTGRIVSTITSLNVNANAITRIKQYEASQKKKGFNIAKAIVKAKIENQIKVLQKYTQDIQSLKCRIEGLKSYNARKMDMNVRDKLGLFEAVASSYYLKRIYKQFPQWLQTKNRVRRYGQIRAKDPLNNLLNLSYEVLKAEIYRCVLMNHLDPYVGFNHLFTTYSEESLVYDLIDPYRPFLEDWLVGYSQKLKKEDFELNGDRHFLKQEAMFELIKAINQWLDTKVVPSKRWKHSNKCRVRVAMNETVVKLGQYIRDEKPSFKPLSF